MNAAELRKLAHDAASTQSAGPRAIHALSVKLLPGDVMLYASVMERMALVKDPLTGLPLYPANNIRDVEAFRWMLRELAGRPQPVPAQADERQIPLTPPTEPVAVPPEPTKKASRDSKKKAAK